MIAFFPKPYPEEDFRSIIHRYHVRAGNMSFEETNKQLFNVKSKRNIYFHHNIIELVSLLSEDYTVLYFLDNHTIFPLISPFISTEKKHFIIQSLWLKDSLRNKKIFLDYISKETRYCPTCLKDDYENYGEVFSHRLHQINFLNCCDKHNTKLIDKCPECHVSLSNHNNKELLTIPFCKNGHCLTMSADYIEDSESLKRMLQDIKVLISYSEKIDRDLVVNILYSALGKQGYGEIYSECIQLKKLKEDFSDFVISKSRIFNIQDFNLSRIFYLLISKKGNVRPNIFAYLLLTQFTLNTVETFLNISEGYSVDIPFKNNPQPCLNKICDYYNRPIISKYKKKYYPMYVSGIFSCPQCNYTYGRKWIWNKGERGGEIKKPFLLKWGGLLEDEVTKLYYQGLSLKEITNLIESGTTKESIAKFLKEKLKEEYKKRFNPKTSRILHCMNLRIGSSNGVLEKAILEIEAGMSEVSATDYNHKLLLLRRQNIINIINENPTFTRKQIEKLARTDYRWLNRNDSVWFNKMLPKPLTRNTSKKL